MHILTELCSFFDTCMHAYIHACSHVLAYSHWILFRRQTMSSVLHTHMLTYMHAHACICSLNFVPEATMFSLIHTHMHAYMHAHACICSLNFVPEANVFSLIHTHMHTYMLAHACLCSLNFVPEATMSSLMRSAHARSKPLRTTDLTIIYVIHTNTQVRCENIKQLALTPYHNLRHAHIGHIRESWHQAEPVRYLRSP
jgi:hypothetical protein